MSQPPTVDQARAALEAMGGTILFEKVLTTSDASGTGRLVIPKGQAEAHFPHLEEPSGIVLNLTDTEGTQHSFRFRFWINNQSRMYLLENTGDVQAQYSMGPGDVLVFAKLPGGGYAICGRKGTKDDVTRKPASRRTREESAASAAEARSKRARARGSDSSKARRQRQKQAAQAVSGMFGYWAAHSIPIRKDGVFRAVPPSASQQEGDKVVAQCGAWSAIVSVEGELFQAFFDSLDAANAALEAALQASVAEDAALEAAITAAVGAKAEAARASAARGAAPARDSQAAAPRGAAAEPPAGPRAAEAAAVAAEPAGPQAADASPAASPGEALRPGSPPQEQQQQQQQQQQQEVKIEVPAADEATALGAAA